MGFRAGSGTLSLAQLLSDLIQLCGSVAHSSGWPASTWRRRLTASRGGPSSGPCGLLVWPPSWWSASPPSIGISAAASATAPSRGNPWHASNGLAQGCPASLLNVLLETFHRWAVVSVLGVPITPDISIASASFADDVALAAPSQPQLESLIAAYLVWCHLLGVRVTKVQLWSSADPGVEVDIGT